MVKDVIDERDRERLSVNAQQIVSHSSVIDLLASDTHVKDN
jgi:hypothetical protein